MEKRRLGKTDMEVTALGFGGAEIGRQHVPEKTVERLLNSALDAGLNVIDTAECYRKSEERIGNAVSHRRQDYYLFTKCGHSAGLNTPDWEVGTLEQSIDRSLKRLKTDYIDVIQLHGCSRRPLKRGDVITVLQKARDAGKVRYIGYSGDGKDALYAIECGAFDTLQTSLSLADQECLDLTLPVAAAKQIGVIVKRPIANASWHYAERPSSKYIVPYWERLQELAYEFLKGDMNAGVDIALRFTLSSQAVSTAIVGTTHPDRWVQNAQLIAQGSLPQEQYEAIRARWKQIAQPKWIGQD